VSEALPGTPPPSLDQLWGNLSPRQKAALLPHLTGNTSADWIAQTLTIGGHRLSASTIRTYRRAIRQNGV
jgi:hypothetical protein